MEYLDYITIPHQVMRNKNLKQLDHTIYGVIYTLANLTKKKCIASNTTLSRLAMTTPNTVQHSLQRLEDEGCIKRVYKDKNNRVRLEIIPLIVFGKVLLTDNTVLPTDNTQVLPTDNQSKKDINKKDNSISHTTTTVVGNEDSKNYNQKDVSSILSRWKEIDPVNFSDRFYKIPSYRKAIYKLLDNSKDVKSVHKFLDKYIQLMDEKYAPMALTPVVMVKKLRNIVKFIDENSKKL